MSVSTEKSEDRKLTEMNKFCGELIRLQQGARETGVAQEWLDIAEYNDVYPASIVLGAAVQPDGWLDVICTDGTERYLVRLGGHFPSGRPRQPRRKGTAL